MSAPESRNYAATDFDLFDLLTHPIWVFDIEEKCMYWANTSALKLWQADSLQTLVSRDFKTGMTDATRIKMDDQLLQLRDGKVLSEQWTMYPQNKPTTVNMTGSGIRIHDGRVAALMEAEISEKKYEDNTIRGIELLRQLPMPVFQFKIDGTFVYRNPEAVRVYGAEMGFLGHFVDKTLGEKCFEQVIDGDDCSVEAEHHTADGTTRWFSVSVRRARDPIATGKEEYVILMSARDITEVLQARKDSATASLKADFLAILAHDIRTPLHQIIGFVDVLGSSELEPEQKEQVYMMQSAAASLVSFTNDLLDYSKLENNQFKMDTVCLELPQLIGGCVAAVKQDAEEKGLQIAVSVGNGLPAQIVGDPNQLRRILYNLLENAIKFTSAGVVSLTVSVTNKSEELLFEISDTGIGLDSVQQQLLFEKFLHSRNYGGSGLGLAICRGLVEAMGGTIGLRSEVGKGSTFSVKIPLELPRKRSRPSDDQLANDSELSKHKGEKSLRVLVVEDNKINQKVARAMLQRIGHSVTVAENGQLAIDEVRNGTFDLVLMDRMMPIMDGIEATKAIREMGLSKADLPIVGLTASFQHSELGFYLDCGMNDCLGKPLKLASLKRVIQETTVGAKHSGVVMG